MLLLLLEQGCSHQCFGSPVAFGTVVQVHKLLHIQYQMLVPLILQNVNFNFMIESYPNPSDHNRIDFQILLVSHPMEDKSKNHPHYIRLVSSPGDQIVVLHVTSWSSEVKYQREWIVIYPG